jgi:dsRNA-specific ribonuclease
MMGKKKRKAKNVPATKWRANTFETYVGELYKQDGEEGIRKQFDPLWKVLLGLIAKYNIKR